VWVGLPRPLTSIADQAREDLGQEQFDINRGGSIGVFLVFDRIRHGVAVDRSKASFERSPPIWLVARFRCTKRFDLLQGRSPELSYSWKANQANEILPWVQEISFRITSPIAFTYGYEVKCTDSGGICFQVGLFVADDALASSAHISSCQIV
jgi:hypothetical protein